MIRLLIVSVLLLVIATGSAYASQRKTWWGEEVHTVDEAIKRAYIVAVVSVEDVTPLSQWHIPDGPMPETYAEKRDEWEAAMKRDPELWARETSQRMVWSRIASARVEEVITGAESDEKILRLNCGSYPAPGGNELLNACMGGAGLKAGHRFLVLVKPNDGAYCPVGYGCGYFPIEADVVRGFACTSNGTPDRSWRQRETSMSLSDAVKKIRAVRGVSGMSGAAAANHGIWTPSK